MVSTQCLHCVIHAFETSGYQKWGQEIVSTQFPHCVLHAFERPQGTRSEAEGVSQLNFRIGFYTPLSGLRVPEVRPRDCLNSISALCSTRLWATSGYWKIGPAPHDARLVAAHLPHSVCWLQACYAALLLCRWSTLATSEWWWADVGHRMRDTFAVPLLHCAIPWLCQRSLESVRNYWNAAFVLLFISICNDMGVILCHPELLEYSTCIALLAYVTIWESFYVIRNYWHTAFVLLFISICSDMGVISCHPELLEYSVCIAFYYHI